MECGNYKPKISIATFLYSAILLLMSSMASGMTLSVTKTTDKASSGGYVYHKIILANDTGSTKVDVTLHVNIGANTFFTDALPYQSGGCSGTCDSNETARWEFGDIAPGAFKVVTLPVYSSNLSTGDERTLTANVTYSGQSSSLEITKTSTINNTPSVALHVAAKSQVAASDEEVDFEISYGNVGNIGIATPSMEVNIPAGMSFVSASHNGVVSNNKIVWDLPALNSDIGNKYLFTLKKSASSSNGEIDEISASFINSSNVIATSEDSVVTSDLPQLSLIVSANNDIWQAGSYSMMRYIVSNNSGVAVPDVSVFSMLAPGTAHTDSMPYINGGCSGACDSAEWGRWELGTIGAGESRVVTVPIYNSNSDSGEPIESLIQVTVGSGQYSLGTRATVIRANEPTMELVISPSKGIISNNESIKYQLTLGNQATSAYTQMKLLFSIPEGFDYVSSSDGGAVVGANVEWNLGTVNPSVGSTRFVEIAPSSPLANGEVVSVEAKLENDAWVQRSTDSVVVDGTLNLDVTASIQNEMSQQSELTFVKVLLANNGTLNISDVNISMMVPSRTGFTLPMPGITAGCSGACDAAEWARWNFPVIGAGESRFITVPIYYSQITKGEPLEIQLHVNDATESYNLTLQPTFVAKSDNDLQLSLVSDKQQVAAGERVRYEMTYGQLGSDAYTDMMLKLPIPENLTFVSGSDGAFIENGQLQWNLGTVNPGDGGMYYAYFDVDTELTEGTAITVDATIHNSAERLQRSTDSIVIKEDIKLTLKASRASTLHQQGLISYQKFVVANEGALDISDVQLHIQTGFQLHHSRTFPGISAGCSGVCDYHERGRWILDTLKAGESRTISIPFYTNTAVSGEPLDVIAYVTEASGNLQVAARQSIITSLPPIEMVLSSQRSVIKANEVQSFQASFGNSSTSAYPNALLKVMIPDGYSYQSATGVHEMVGSAVYWPLGTIEASHSGSVSFDLKANSTLTNGEVLKVEAEIVSEDDISSITGSSLVTAIHNQVPFVLDVQNVYTSPVTSASTATVNLDLEVTSPTQISEVIVTSNSPQYSAYPNNSTSGGCSGTCDGGEWGWWDLGNQNSGAVVPISYVLSMSSNLPVGKLLIGNYAASSTSSPIIMQAISTVIPTGTLVTTASNHDSDGDNIPDWWEIRYLGAMNWLLDDSSGDADGDGYSNWDEFSNNTSPSDSASTPPDNDGDFISDLLDPDDDNDGVNDEDDAFPFDPTRYKPTKFDVDGDGNADLLWRSFNKGWNFLWAMDGTQISEATPINVVQEYTWTMDGLGDYDGDGKSDILWRNSDTGKNFIYLMDGANIKDRYVLNYVTAETWQLVGNGDFDADGVGDVMWRNVERGDTWFYLMENGRIGTSKPSLWVTDLNYQVAATGDLDGDGDEDIIWRRSTTGLVYIWLMEEGEISNQYSLITANTNWQIAGTGDLDGDGTADIIMRNQVDGRNWVYLMEDGQIETSTLINEVADLNWQVGNIGDYDGDGKADLMWRNEVTTRNIVHLMDGTTVKSRGVLRPTDNTWQVAK
ncbi:VCBS repeat-containing protein [uncultured Alteromonas sp.]|jgi:hypothetical protein|uniref:FG-GAP repeat domain-containing protein n=1 Tax=uncultured Alteromonas sp. TaxID=179113 RepID=UPI002584A749|nr:VCBS repeat-containing protein [uncultured Alteromonas sp.]